MSTPYNEHATWLPGEPCPDCGHADRYHRPQRGDKPALCFYPTHLYGPDCRCTRPRPSGEDA